MRVTISFPTRRAAVIADGKKVGVFRDSVEIDAESIELQEVGYHENLKSDAPEQPAAQPNQVPVPASVEVDVDVEVKTPQAREGEKRFVVSEGRKDDNGDE